MLAAPAAVTPSEWSAIIAGGAALVGAAMGSVATFLVTDRQVRSAEREGSRQRTYDEGERRKQREHELALAREEREQQRKRDAYLAVMQHLTWGQQYTRWRLGELRWRFSPPATEPVVPDLRGESEAIAALFTSETAADMVVEFNRRLFDFSRKAEAYEAALPGPSRPGKLTEAKEAAELVFSYAVELRACLREELGNVANPEV